MDISQSKTFHFIGIGGSGMSPIAQLLLKLGYSVSGSDLKESIQTIRLKDLGAKVFYEQHPDHLRGADIVVVSSAIQADNPELIAAKEEGYVIYKRAQILNLVMGDYEKRIAVVGTHGKTTTSAMVARMLDACKKRPTFVIGASLHDYGKSSGLLGKEYFVAESDESDGTFLMMEPTLAVVTNIEEEHMDFYGTRENLLEHFLNFMSGVVERQGVLFLNQDNPTLHELAATLPQENCRYVSTQNKAAYCYASDIEHNAKGVSFMLHVKGRPERRIQLTLKGVHNVYNALAVIAIGLHERCALDSIEKGVSQFSGTHRRLETICVEDGITVFDDYAHHPTEIETTLNGLKLSLKQPITAVFQPHRYSRTKDLLTEFSTVFKDADRVVVTDIFSANEKETFSISSKDLVETIGQHHDNVHYVSKKSDVSPFLMTQLKAGEVVITMGAGDIYTVAKELEKQLKLRSLNAQTEDLVDS